MRKFLCALMVTLLTSVPSVASLRPVPVVTPAEREDIELIKAEDLPVMCALLERDRNVPGSMEIIALRVNFVEDVAALISCASVGAERFAGFDLWFGVRPIYEPSFAGGFGCRECLEAWMLGYLPHPHPVALVGLRAVQSGLHLGDKGASFPPHRPWIEMRCRFVCSLRLPPDRCTMGAIPY